MVFHPAMTQAHLKNLTSRKEKLPGNILITVFLALPLMIHLITWNGYFLFRSSSCFVFKCTHAWMHACICSIVISLKWVKQEQHSWLCLYRWDLTSWFCNLLGALKVISKLGPTVKRRVSEGTEEGRRERNSMRTCELEDLILKPMALCSNLKFNF